MATVFSAQRTNTRANPTVKNKANELGGRVRVAHATYTAAALASADVIELFVLPNGARLVTGSMANAALGASTTVSIGYAAYKSSANATVALSAAAYLAATSTSSAAKTDILATLALGSGSVLDADANGVTITATIGGAAATGALEVTILYVVD